MTNPFERPKVPDFSQPVTSAELVTPEVGEDGRGMVVILERVEPGVEPDYCVHGKVTCYAECGEWCWLGEKTYELIRSGKAAGICVQCAENMTVPGGWDQYRIGNANDTEKGLPH